MRVKPTGVSLPSDLVAALDARAALERRSRSNLIALYVRRGLESADRAEKEAPRG